MVKNLAPDITVFGEHEPRTIAQLQDVASRAERAALMADGHVGYVMPIGGVAAYRDQVSVVGVGFDIACGNAAIRTDLTLHGTPGLADRLPAIADEIQDVVSFGIGRKNRSDDAPVDHPLFKADAWDGAAAAPATACATRRARSSARSAAATTTSTCSSTRPTRSGSASTSAAAASVTRSRPAFSRSRRARSGARACPSARRCCSLDKPMGQDYWALMTLAGEYAYAGREWVARKVVSLLGGRELELVHNHHNFAWREEHDGRRVVVVRKGATPAFPARRASSAARWATMR